MQVSHEFNLFKELLTEVSFGLVRLVKFDKCPVEFLNQGSLLFFDRIDLRQKLLLHSHHRVSLAPNEPVSVLFLLSKHIWVLLWLSRLQ